MERDNEIKKILEELNDNNNLESFNRKYFEQTEFFTPQNTPSNRNGAQIHLNTLDFSKYIEKNYSETNQDESPHKSGTEYCDPAYIGKTGLQLGLDTTNYQKICNNLICTKCDVKVTSFKNKKWNGTCDYMFFRNNYGNENKLKEKLISSNGCVSYSCQCSWITIDDGIKPLDDVSEVTWTCNGHN